VSALAAATILAPTRADAMTIGTASGIRAAIEGTNVIEDVRTVCSHNWNTSRRWCRWVPSRRQVCTHRWNTSRRVCYWR
jgi:hypothetical protein